MGPIVDSRIKHPDARIPVLQTGSKGKATKYNSSIE